MFTLNSSESEIEQTQPKNPEDASMEETKAQVSQENEASKLSILDSQIKELETQLKQNKLRAMADIANLEKRHATVLEQTRQFALEKFIQRLLPILDSFDGVMDHINPEKFDTAFVEGLTLVQKMLLDTLQKEGLQAITETGVMLDPNKHHVMRMEPNPGVPAQQVLQIYQKGYMLHYRLIRPALVSVAETVQTHESDQA